MKNKRKNIKETGDITKAQKISSFGAVFFIFYLSEEKLSVSKAYDIAVEKINLPDSDIPSITQMREAVNILNPTFVKRMRSRNEPVEKILSDYPGRTFLKRSFPAKQYSEVLECDPRELLD